MPPKQEPIKLSRSFWSRKGVRKEASSRSEVRSLYHTSLFDLARAHPALFDDQPALTYAGTKIMILVKKLGLKLMTSICFRIFRR